MRRVSSTAERTTAVCAKKKLDIEKKVFINWCKIPAVGSEASAASESYPASPRET